MSPGGTEIALVTNWTGRPGNYLRDELLLLPAADGAPRSLVQGAGYVRWSPDARHLAFIAPRTRPWATPRPTPFSPPPPAAPPAT